MLVRIDHLFLKIKSQTFSFVKFCFCSEENLTNSTCFSLTFSPTRQLDSSRVFSHIS